MSIKFRIIVPFFNAEKYIKNCIASIKNQTFKDFSVYLIDDCSTDNSFEVAKSVIENDPRFFLKKNKENYGALHNIVQGLKFNCKNPSNIIDILIDGDDYLYSNIALQIVYFTYLNTNCLITYGTFFQSGNNLVFGRKYPLQTILKNSYRNDLWLASHLRTFRHDLWLKIKDSDLRDKDGAYYPTAWDLAIMFPMLEMAELRQECISDILYVYNNVNPLCDHIINRENQKENELIIRKKPPYKKVNFE
ncbi:MAG: glycosyl transferase [Flavobacteriales bacterium]|nr:glycosyl transferase [Flavobacteriales bacterium]|tara:strand:- start:660 stop:1403 length:744 start_codon:yes stop_codon:yes gene_type:complete